MKGLLKMIKDVTISGAVVAGFPKYFIPHILLWIIYLMFSQNHLNVKM